MANKDTEALVKETSLDYGSTSSLPADPRKQEQSDTLKSTGNKEQQTCCSKIFPMGFVPHAKNLLKTAWVLMITLLSQFTFGIVAVMFCGRIGKYELDAVSLANSLINVLGLSFSVGLSSACDTLFSQIYGTDKKYLAGVVLQRSMIIMLLATMPLIALHLNAQHVLIFLGQEPIISQMVGDYLLLFLPAIVLYPVFMSVSKFLQNQTIVFPTMVFGLISNLTNILLHVLLVQVLGGGLPASAISQAVSYCLMAVMNIVYVVSGRGLHNTWAGWSMDCLQDWGQFANLALFGFLMTCIEWWAFELGIFLTGIKGTTELGAQTVIFQYESIMYMCPYGVSIATSIGVGTYLGENRPLEAKTTAHVGLTIAVIIGSIFASTFILAREYLPYVFTNVPEVITLAADVLPILGVFTVFDALCCVYGGILRGTGRQYVGAAFVTIGYITALAIGIPLLFLTHLSILGFWMGLAVAMFMVCGLYSLFLYTRNWEKEADSTRERVEAVSAGAQQNIPTETSALVSNPEDVTGCVATGDHKLSGWSLFWRRGAVIVTSFGVALVGVICRLVFPPPDVSFEWSAVTNGTVFTTMMPHMETTT